MATLPVAAKCRRVPIHVAARCLILVGLLWPMYSFCSAGPAAGLALGLPRGPGFHGSLHGSAQKALATCGSHLTKTKLRLHRGRGHIVSPERANLSPLRKKHAKTTSMHYLLSWREGGYLDWTYRTVETSIAATARISRQYYRSVALGLALLSAPLLYALVHFIVPHSCHHMTGSISAIADSLGLPRDFLSWMAEPGRPDPTFGSLCLYSNVFFASLVPVLWFRRLLLEMGFITMVGTASTIYHGLQIHPSWGPLHSWTQLACVFDIGLALTFGAILVIRHPRTRMRGLPAISGALVCFLVPCFLPCHMAEVGYSWMHSAWHGFSALAAYQIVSKVVSVSDSEKQRSLGRDANLVRLLLR